METDLDVIQERLDALYRRQAQREREARRARQERARARQERARAGRPQTERTKAKLSAITYAHNREVALADPDIHPLRRARLTYGGDGLTQKALAEKALVDVTTIQDIECRRIDATAITGARLARALDTAADELGL